MLKILEFVNSFPSFRFHISSRFCNRLVELVLACLEADFCFLSYGTGCVPIIALYELAGKFHPVLSLECAQ